MKFRGIQVILGLSLWLTTQPPLPPSVMAQSPVQTQIDCTQENAQAAESEVLMLLQELGTHFENKAIPETSQSLVLTLKAIQALEQSETRASFLYNLVVDEPSSVDKSLLTRLITRVLTTEETASLTPVLTEAIATAQTLNSGSSFMKTRVLTSIAQAYLRIDQGEQAIAPLDLALSSSETIEGTELQTLALLPIADTYISLDQKERAIAILQDLQTRVEAFHDPDPYRRVNLLSSVAQSYAKAGETDPALQIARQMGHYPDAQGSILLEVVRAYLLNDAREEGVSLAQAIRQPRYRALALAEVATVEATQGNSAQASPRLAQAIAAARSANDRESTLLEVLKLYQGSNPDATLRIAQSLEDPEKRSVILILLMETYLKADRMQEADRVVEQIIPAIQAIPAYANDEYWAAFQAVEAIDKAIALGAYPQAIRLTQMPNYAFFYPPSKLLDIATQAATRGELEVAQEAVQMMPAPDTGYITAEYSMKAKGLRPVVAAYVQADRLTEAIALVEQWGTGYPVERVVGFAAIAQQLALQNEDALANRYFTQAQQTAASIQDPLEQVKGLRAIALAYKEANQSTQAETSLDHIQTIAVAVEDPFNRGMMLQGVIEGLIQESWYEGVFQLLPVMPTNETSYYTLLNSLTEQAYQEGNDAAFLQALEYFTQPESRVGGLLRLADRRLRAGQEQEAIPLLEQAFQHTLTIADPESRMLIFGAEGGTQVEDPADRASMLEAIALRYARYGYLDQARQTAAAIQDPNLRDQLTQRILCLNSST